MSVLADNLYNEVIDGGVADSPAAKLYLEQALEPFVGSVLDVSAVMDDLQDHFSPEALRRIHSILDCYDGENISSM